MSKNSHLVREKILDRALELFNEQGIEYIGVRELAKDLGTKPGNITYYFPTKDDIVLAVGERLSALNNETIRLPEQPSLLHYLQMIRQSFDNHYKFRCLFYSQPNLMRQNEKLAEGYIGNVEKERRRTLKDYFTTLRNKRFLVDSLSDKDMDVMVSMVAIIARSWIGDASISFRDKDVEWCKAHYLNIVSNYIAGYSTPKGLAEIRTFSSETVSSLPA